MRTKRLNREIYAIITRKRCIILVLLQFLCLQLSAQTKLRLQHISLEQGLSQTSVNGICQDATGFIWLATGDGLNRFDGREITVFKNRLDDTSSIYLHDRNINSRLIEDDSSRIWMASDAGISFFNYKRARSRVVVDRRQSGSSVLLGYRNGVLWSAIPTRGFFSLDTRTLTLHEYTFADSVQKDRTAVTPILAGLVTDTAVWMVDEHGLLLLNLKNLTQRRLLHRDDLCSIAPIGNGNFLLPATGGYYRYDALHNQLQFSSITTTAGQAERWGSIALSKDGHAYMASRGGHICKLHIASGSQQLLSFQENPVNALFIDRSENLWIGTEGGGAYKMDIKPAKFYCFSPQLPDGKPQQLMVKSLYKDRFGRIWYGTVDDGLHIYDPATTITKPVLNLPVAVTALYRDSSGCVIAACGSDLLWLDEATAGVKKKLRLPAIAHASSRDPLIYAIAEYKAGHLIVAANTGTYMVNAEGIKPVAWYTPAHSNTIFGSWTYNVICDKNGDVYLCWRNGFATATVINDSSMALKEAGFDNLCARHCYKSTTTPVVWIATEQGLLAYDTRTKKFQVFDERNGIANSYIYSILPYTDSNLWVSTNKGLCNIKVRYAEVGNIGITAKNYTAEDGLQSDEFNTGAFHRAQDGTFLFGGINGFNWFHPPAIRHNPYAPQPALAAIFVNDTAYAADTAAHIRQLDLSYQQNTLTFSLRALEYTQPHANMFAYMLSGHDKDWVLSSNDKVRYSNLPPGHYTFLLKARNNDGLWNERPLQVQVTIRPPYWQTWWFRLAAVLLVIAVAGVVIRYYIVQRIRTRTLQLEKQQALNLERLRISRDVHDDLGAGLSRIALMAEMAQKQVMNDITLGKEIRSISAASKDLIDNMRDLIWVLNPENTTLDNLVARIREYSSDYLENTNIIGHLHFPAHVPALHITREAQRNIFSTVKEAINNCVKHASATSLTIQLSLEHEVFAIYITDDGRGIPAEARQRGNGLRNMRQRIEMLGGEFTLDGSSRGTAISITIPLLRLAQPATASVS